MARACPLLELDQHRHPLLPNIPYWQIKVPVLDLWQVSVWDLLFGLGDCKMCPLSNCSERSVSFVLWLCCTGLGTTIWISSISTSCTRDDKQLQICPARVIASYLQSKLAEGNSYKSKRVCCVFISVQSHATYIRFTLIPIRWLIGMIWKSKIRHNVFTFRSCVGSRRQREFPKPKDLRIRQGRSTIWPSFRRQWHQVLVARCQIGSKSIHRHPRRKRRAIQEWWRASWTWWVREQRKEGIHLPSRYLRPCSKQRIPWRRRSEQEWPGRKPGRRQQEERRGRSCTWTLCLWIDSLLRAEQQVKWWDIDTQTIIIQQIDNQLTVADDHSQVTHIRAYIEPAMSVYWNLCHL